MLVELPCKSIPTGPGVPREDEKTTLSIGYEP